MNKKNNWVKNEIKTVGIRDERLVKRLEHIITKFSENAEGQMPKAFEQPKDIKALYRFLSNDDVDAGEILDAHRRETINRIKNHDTVLLIQDTTSFNYEKGEHIKGMGVAGKYDNSKGLIMHSTLAANTEGTPLGVLSEDIWTRDAKERGKKSCKRDRNNSHKFKTEEKESQKWINALRKSNEGIPDDIKTVYVCDREADIYKFFYEILEAKRDFVIRSGSRKRRVDEEMKLLSDKIEASPVRGTVKVNIPRNTKEGYPARTAILSIKYCEASIRPPAQKPEFKGMPKLAINVILAEEVDAPEGENAIKWCLLTSLPVESVDEAFEKVQWYKCRWLIERFHYILKSGCQIEKVRLEDVERIKRLISIHSIVAWRIGWITYESRNNAKESCEKILSKEEWTVLYCVVNETQNIPKKPPTIEEAVIMVAKLGGFRARRSDGNPGVKVIWRGLLKLSNIMIGWQMARLVVQPKHMGT